jgi:hypothetical protein
MHLPPMCFLAFWLNDPRIKIKMPPGKISNIIMCEIMTVYKIYDLMQISRLFLFLPNLNNFNLLGK